jgi:YD repeat-containing protein
VNYKYNGNGQLSEIADNKSIILRAEYNSKGRIIRRQLGNNASTHYEYDPISGLLKKMSNHYPNGTLASFFSYTYSTRKRRVAVDTLDGKWKFNYDRAGQVVTMTDPRGHVTEYIYDSTKNRKIVSINGVESFSTINEMNQYTKYRDKILKYDKNGNVIQRKGNNSSENYTFDEENKIVSYKSNSDQCNFEYDALGNLFMKECNGHAMEFVINPTGNNDMDILEKVCIFYLALKMN